MFEVTASTGNTHLNYLWSECTAVTATEELGKGQCQLQGT